MIKEWKAGERTASSIYKYFEISPQTFYRRVNEMEKIEADRKAPKESVNLGKVKVSKEKDSLVLTQE